MLAAQAGSTPWPVLHTFGGATLSEWVGGWSTLSNLKWQDVVRYGSHDRAVIALGSNDIHAGKDLAALKRNFSRLVELVTDRISSRIVASTVTPRSSWAHTEPAKETVRQHFNDWLTQLPENIAACIDTAGAVTDASGRAPATDLIEPDGIHFNTAGSLRCADAYAHVGQTGL